MQAMGILGAGVICWALWGVTDHLRLLIWLGAITVVIAGRIVIAIQFQRRDPLPMEMPPWERLFIFTLGLVSLVWGVGGWLIMPADSILHQAVVFFFLLGVSGAVVTGFSAHAVAAYVGVLGVMVPPTLAFAFKGTFELQLMAAGAVIYLVAALRSTRITGFFMRRTFELSFELHGGFAQVRELSRTDELTGLANRRAFMSHGRAAVDQAKRYARPLSLLMIDIDHFKKINDTYGHPAGDEALRTMADVLRRVSRAADTVGRLGGEEFAMLLPETSADEATIFAERLRMAVKELIVEYKGTTITFTCSIGLAQEGGALDTVDTLLHAADEALYEAKTEGRDRVVRYGG